MYLQLQGAAYPAVRRDEQKQAARLAARELALSAAFAVMENPKSLIRAQDEVRWVFDFPPVPELRRPVQQRATHLER